MSFVSLTETVQSLRWLRARWSSMFFVGASAAELAFYRLLFYGFILYSLGFQIDIRRWAEVSDAFWSPTSFFRVFHLPVLSAASLIAILWVWRLSLVLAFVGLFTRLSTLVALVLGFYVIGLPQNFGKVHHNDAIVVIGLAIFAFSRCGDAWSLDGLRRARPRAGGSYSWPIELYRLMLALVLFSAGVAKLSTAGPVAWVLSNNLYYNVLAHQYTHAPPSGLWLLLTRYPWTCQVLAGSALTLELSAPLLVLLTGRWRTLLAAGMVGMMIGFWQILGVFFRELIVLLVIFFFPWRQVGARLVRGSGSPHLAVLYDGSCGLCNQTIAVVRALDLLRRVEAHDVLGDWLRVSTRWPALDQKTCLEDMHVITEQGRVHVGFYGYRALAWHLPLGWLLLPVLYTPGVPAIGQRVYSFVARRRHRTGCALPM
jgi:predicted DCC family thiol-disulfide oxidoreductase YuxK